jgi:hypothetical protein
MPAGRSPFAGIARIRSLGVAVQPRSCPASQPFLPAAGLPGTPFGPAPSITSQTMFTLHGASDGHLGPKALACPGPTSWLRRKFRQRSGPYPVPCTAFPAASRRRAPAPHSPHPSAHRFRALVRHYCLRAVRDWDMDCSCRPVWCSRCRFLPGPVAGVCLWMRSVADLRLALGAVVIPGAGGLSGIGKYPWAMFSPLGPSLRELAMQALSSVEGGYDLLAPKFDHTPFRTPDGLLDATAGALRPLGPFGRGLDVCCGTGAGMRVLISVCQGPIMGVDFSAGMLAQARRRAARTRTPRGYGLTSGPCPSPRPSTWRSVSERSGTSCPPNGPRCSPACTARCGRAGFSLSRSVRRSPSPHAGTGHCSGSTWPCGSAMPCGVPRSSCTTAPARCTRSATT